MGQLRSTPFHDGFDLDITLRDASLDAVLPPTRRMIAAASIGMEVDDAYYAVRELRQAIGRVHEGEAAGKRRLAAILSNDGTDDYQRCVFYCLAGRGVVQMLDDLDWLEGLLRARGLVTGKLARARVRVGLLVDPYVAKEPDGPVGTVPENFAQGSSWWSEPPIAG